MCDVLFFPFFRFLGASLAGASTALCSGALSDGNGKSPPLKAVPLAGGASAKPAPSYTDRLVRLMHLVDPRHAFTTAEDVQRYRALVEESKAAQVCRRIHATASIFF